MRWRGVVAGLLVLVLLGAFAWHLMRERPSVPPAPGSEYETEVAEWILDREAGLRSEAGYLTLVALSWLGDDEVTIGSAPDADIRLAEDAAPALVGTLLRQGDRVLFRSAEASGAVVNGRPVAEALLRSDAEEEGPDRVQAGRVTFYPVSRGERLGIRAKDPQAPTLLAFEGVERYPVERRYRVAARYEPYDEPRTVQVPSAIGTPQKHTAPGELVFQLEEGGTQRLIAFSEHGGAEGFFLIFRDETSGSETYGPGRFLETAPPDDEGWVIVDFNRAYNPPCYFTPFATCPYPPRENVLSVPVRAGEKAMDEEG